MEDPRGDDRRGAPPPGPGADRFRVSHHCGWSPGSRGRFPRGRRRSPSDPETGWFLSAESILRLTVQTLVDLEIPYMVTGSLASAFHGEPRSTQDLDVVVTAREDHLQKLGERLRDAGLYCDSEAIREAAELTGLFNAIDPGTGWKVDFIILKDQAFSRAAFEARSRLHRALGHRTRSQRPVVSGTGSRAGGEGIRLTGIPAARVPCAAP